jgi:hypothetical protein
MTDPDILQQIIATTTTLANLDAVLHRFGQTMTPPEIEAINTAYALIDGARVDFLVATGAYSREDFEIQNDIGNGDSGLDEDELGDTGDMPDYADEPVADEPVADEPEIPEAPPEKPKQIAQPRVKPPRLTESEYP